jgi:DNA-binding Lrp family transcriptional regulator
MNVPEQRCRWLRDSGCGPVAVSVWRWLEDFVDGHGEFFIGKRTLAARMGFSPNTVSAAFAELEATGVIVRTGRKVSRAHVYRLVLRADPAYDFDLDAARLAREGGQAQLDLGPGAVENVIHLQQRRGGRR